MKITRDVITDLLPVYLAGEASELARERDQASLEAAGHATARQETDRLLHAARDALAAAKERKAAKPPSPPSTAPKV